MGGRGGSVDMCTGICNTAVAAVVVAGEGGTPAATATASAASKEVGECVCRIGVLWGGALQLHLQSRQRGSRSTRRGRRPA